MKQQEVYEIHGILFKAGKDGERGKTVEDTAFFHVGTDSMIDHQRTWYEEALKLGYVSGELDEATTIRKNYDGEITEEEMMAIINDKELMDTPLDELFSSKIDEYLEELNGNVKTYRIPVVWQSWGVMEIPAKSLEEAKAKALGSKTPLPESEYVDDSIQIDEESDILGETLK